jgi:very-short-patch-repair endonuclease
MVKLRDTSTLLYHYGAKPATIDRAQQLRKISTEAESLLWIRLRNKKLEGLKFRRQHPIGRFIVDFYCHEKRLVVEVDGGIHNEAEIKERDEGREDELRSFGLAILRFTNEEVINNMKMVLEKLKESIQ